MRIIGGIHFLLKGPLVSRELSQHHAFQTRCLADLGVVSWFQQDEPVNGAVWLAPNPWQMPENVAVSSPSMPIPELDMEDETFTPHQPSAPVVPVDEKQKDASVANLRRQLDAGPEVIVEDLQPIEEEIAPIQAPVAEVDIAGARLPMPVHLCAYWLAEQILIITDLPRSFADQEALDKLSLSLAKALLKQDISAWQSAHFEWPGKLTNRHLMARVDWAVGGFEQFIANQLVAALPAKLIVAGEQSRAYLDELNEQHPLRHIPTANVHSLPQMLRIPELRKEAWGVMQSSFSS